MRHKIRETIPKELKEKTTSENVETEINFQDPEVKIKNTEKTSQTHQVALIDLKTQIESDFHEYKLLEKEKGNPNWKSIQLEDFLSTYKIKEARVLYSTKLGKNMEKDGIERPEDCQAHHLIPDEVVRKHPILQYLRKQYGDLYFDKAENGIFLPSKRNTNHPTYLKSLPTHRGPHPRYTQQVILRLNKLEGKLIEKYGSLEKVPLSILEKKIKQLQNNLKKVLEKDLSLRKDDRLC